MTSPDEPMDATSRCLMWGVAGYAVGMLIVVPAAHMKYRFLEPLIAFLLPVPFGAAGLAAGLLRQRSRLAACVAVLLTTASLAGLYARGFVEVECLMVERKWTAASLSLGFLPFMGLLVSIVVVAASVFLVTTVVGAVRPSRA